MSDLSPKRPPPKWRRRTVPFRMTPSSSAMILLKSMQITKMV